MLPTALAHPDAARIATAVGIFSSGLFAGFSLGLSAIALPALLAGAHSSDKNILPPMFARLYRRGARAAVPLAAISTLALGYSSAAHFSGGADTEGWMLAVAAAACGGAVPFTLTVMKKNISTLIKASEEGGLDIEEQVKELVKWMRLNFVRGSGPLLGFVLTLCAAFW
ncbi:hypothetical protein BV25DRAFT_1843186 [Artomyces pyxidatus]|uniref:Uncharacterized protein n=1 Tax=Artomyces pyxidatus TaxID=48021 RepID=A0ACB8SF11_9AGAM|nr:hypothetical protein BV25DRAFT_1843186 [Artomyces pyxidatus]